MHFARCFIELLRYIGYTRHQKINYQGEEKNKDNQGNTNLNAATSLRKTITEECQAKDCYCWCHHHWIYYPIILNSLH